MLSGVATENEQKTTPDVSEGLAPPSARDRLPNANHSLGVGVIARCDRAL
jgi:hypothetical protein